MNNDKVEQMGSEDDVCVVAKMLEGISRAETDLSRLGQLLESESSATEHGTDVLNWFEEHGEPKSRH